MEAVGAFNKKGAPHRQDNADLFVTLPPFVCIQSGGESVGVCGFSSLKLVGFFPFFASLCSNGNLTKNFSFLSLKGQPFS